MKKLVLIVLSLTILVGTLLVPVAASATTAEDCYNYFAELPQAYEYTEEVKKLMDVVPCSDAQAAVVMTGLQQLKTISARYTGDASWRKTDPRGFTKADINEAISALSTICNALNVTYDILWKPSGTELSAVDDIVVNFYYEGQLIYEYDGDAISRTGTDIPAWPAVAGVVLLAAAAVVVCVKKTKEDATVA